MFTEIGSQNRPYIIPLIDSLDIISLKRGVSDFYLRPTNFELVSIFERLNIRLMDFVNRLVFSDFYKRASLYSRDVEINNNFFDLLKIYILLRGNDSWNLFKINSIFDKCDLERILLDTRMVKSNAQEYRELEQNWTMDKSQFEYLVGEPFNKRRPYVLVNGNYIFKPFIGHVRQFRFFKNILDNHSIDNLDYLLFPYRNNYIFPNRYIFLASDYNLFLYLEGVARIFRIQNLNYESTETFFKHKDFIKTKIKNDLRLSNFNLLEFWDIFYFEDLLKHYNNESFNNNSHFFRGRTIKFKNLIFSQFDIGRALKKGTIVFLVQRYKILSHFIQKEK